MPDSSSSLDIRRLRRDVGRRAADGGLILLAGEAAKLVLNLLSLAVLARLLPPEAFGLMIMVVVLTGFATVFTELGLAAATVQRPEITEAQVSGMFWINAAAGALLAVAVALLAPAIAWFYGESRLTGITVAVSSAFFLGGLGVQHRALLQRQMRFAVMLSIELGGMVCGLVVAVSLALSGYGYWALVSSPVTTTGVTTALAWAVCRWRPSRPSSLGELLPMLSFGGYFTGYTVANYWARNLDKLLIGWWWGSAAVAVYDRAYKLLMLPIEKINTPLGRVMIGALSRIQDDGERWARAYCRALMAAMLLTAPLSTFCVVFADLVIRLLLGRQWDEAAAIFRYLAISGMAQYVWHTVAWIYISRGRTDRMFRWGLVSSAAICLSFLVGLPFGPAGVAIAVSATILALTVPCVVYACRGTPLRPRQVLLAVFPAVAAAVLAGVCAFAVRTSAGPHVSYGDALAVGAFVLTYFALVLPWPGPRNTISFALHRVVTATR